MSGGLWQVTPTTISKVNTVLSLATMGAALASPVFGFPGEVPLTAMFYVTGATTVASGLSYTRPGAVRFIT